MLVHIGSCFEGVADLHLDFVCGEIVYSDLELGGKVVVFEGSLIPYGFPLERGTVR